MDSRSRAKRLGRCPRSGEGACLAHEHDGSIDPLIVGRAHVVYERGERRMGPLR
jgi:hypothetical protein